MKFLLPIRIEIDPADWATEYGLSGPAEVEQHIRESMEHAGHENWAPLALVQAWPALRDLATITAGAATNNPDAAVDALIAAFGLDRLREAVRHHVGLQADAEVGKVVRAAVAGARFAPDAVPVAAVFDTMTYEDGNYLYDGGATIHFADGRDEWLEFDDAEASKLSGALNPDGECASGARVLVNVATGQVERYAGHEQDEAVSKLRAWIKRASVSVS